MSIKLLLCIAMGVLTAHLAVFMIIFRVRLDRLPPAPPEPVQNFSVAEALVIDPQTGDKTVHREFRVSTKLVEPEAAASTRQP